MIKPIRLNVDDMEAFSKEPSYGGTTGNSDLLGAEYLVEFRVQSLCLLETVYRPPIRRSINLYESEPLLNQFISNIL